MKYFEDFGLGDKQVASSTYRVTEEEIIEFGTRFDPQPFHTDPVAAADSIFGGLVASSTHLFSIAVALTQHLGDKVAAVSALGFDGVRVLAPARPGDELGMRTETVGARRSKSRPDCGIVEGSSEMFNQNDEIVFRYHAAFLVLLRAAGEATS